MKDVAREAGVSIAAVSLAFKRNPEIPATTRERLLGIANRIGYRKNPYIAAHMTSRRKGRLPASAPVLAFVSASPSDRAGAAFRGAEARAAARGYRLEPFTISNPGPSALRLGEILYTRNVAGVVFGPLPGGWERVTFPWSRFPVVALGQTLVEPALDRVACDGFHSMTIAMERSHRLGYRRPGLVLIGGTGSLESRLWLAAYLMEHNKRFAVCRLPVCALAEWRESAFVTWLNASRPDVIITPSAERVGAGLAAAGRRAPRDLGLVTLDRFPAEAPVAGVFRNRALLGSRAIDLLAGLVERNEYGIPRVPSTLLIDGVWLGGSSVRGETARCGARWLRRAGREESRPPSMRELARRLGMPVSTVSLGLRDSPLLSAKTRARIRAAASRSGFRGNPFVSKLMEARRRGRLPTEMPPLAFVTAFPTPDGWRRKSRSFVQYFEGARRRAEEKGFRLEEAWVPAGRERGGEVGDALRRRSVQGILVAPLPAAGARLSLRWEWFCTVGFGFTLTTPAIHRVASDHYDAMRLVVRECFRLGYRRIGLALSTQASARVQHRWLASYLEQQRALEGIVPLEPLLARRWTAGTVRRWLRAGRPEVVIASSPFVLLRWLKAWGFRVPQDIGVAALNCPDLWGDLSGVHERAELLGVRAADTLIHLVERGQYGISEHPGTLLVEGLWNPGATVGGAVKGRCRKSIRFPER